MSYMPPRDTDAVSPDDFLIAGENHDGPACQRAFNAVARKGGGKVWLRRFYTTAAALISIGVPLVVAGANSGTCGFIDVGIPPGQYVLNIINDDYRDPVVLRDFSIQTLARIPVSYGLYVEFGAFDATYNRAPTRLTMERMEVGRREANAFGFPEQGFLKGITIKNAIRPRIEAVNIYGKQTGFSEADYTSMVIGWELLSTAAPTDFKMTDSQVLGAGTAVLATGHWEGLFFDASLFIAVSTALNLSTGASYPWVQVRTCHINGFRDLIVMDGYFDVKIEGGVYYKWDFAGAGPLVPSTAIRLKNAHRSRIAGVNFNNLTKDYGSRVQFDAVRLEDTNDALVEGNIMAGVTYGCTFAGTSNGCKYRSGRFAEVPTFGPTPAEYRNLAGPNNVSVA